jgi:hypothetical protein
MYITLHHHSRMFIKLSQAAIKVRSNPEARRAHPRQAEETASGGSDLLGGWRMVSGGDDQLYPHHDPEEHGSLERVLVWLKDERRSFRYWWPRERRFLGSMVIAVFLACSVTVISISATTARDGIGFRGEGLVILPNVELKEISSPLTAGGLAGWFHEWRDDVYAWMLAVLVMSGIVLHGLLVYFELKDRLNARSKKKPVLWGAIAAAGAILVATSTIPEIANLVA